MLSENSFQTVLTISEKKIEKHFHICSEIAQITNFCFLIIFIKAGVGFLELMGKEKYSLRFSWLS